MAETAVAHDIRPLFSAEQIAARVEELARDIVALRLEDPVIVGVLQGSVVFAADLLKALNRLGVRPEIDFLQLASYGDGRQSSGKVEILRDVATPIEGRDVVIADDILDTGRTLSFAKAMLERRGARSVRICVLLDKQVPRAVDVTPDLVGFDCPPVYVVGYGMDLADEYRELPFIGELSDNNA
jgi:hypoxanthine phosphoribosyltransferase